MKESCVPSPFFEIVPITTPELGTILTAVTEPSPVPLTTTITLVPTTAAFGSTEVIAAPTTMPTPGDTTGSRRLVLDAPPSASPTCTPTNVEVIGVNVPDWGASITVTGNVIAFQPARPIVKLLWPTPVA